MDDLLAQLDQIERASEIALHSRAQADHLALQDSLAAGGSTKEAITTTPVGQLGTEAVEPMVPKVGSGGLVTAQAQNPIERMQEVLENLGLPRDGGVFTLPNGEHLYIAISPATAIAMRPGMTGYIRSRQIAYNKADLTARSQMVEFMGTQMALERAVKQGLNEVVGASPAQLTTSSQRLAEAVSDDQLDAELAALGVKMAQVEALSADEKRAILRDTYVQTFSGKAAARLIGVTTLAVTEGLIGGQQMMVVATITSPALQRMASMALDERHRGRSLPSGSKAAALKRLPLDNDVQLARQFGAQMISDGKGNQFVVGYGQIEVRNPRMATIAQQQAVAQARQAIVAFVNESVSSEFEQKITETIRGLASGEQAVSQSIDALAQLRGNAQLQLDGVETITTRTITIDGRQSMIAVCLWSPSGRQAAQAVKQQATKGKPVLPPAGKPTAETKPTPSNGGGGAGNSTTSDF